MHYDTKSNDFKNISEGLIETFRKAGHESIEIEKKGLKIKNKEDGSPVTNGDLRVNEISIKSKLGKHTTTNTTIYHIPSGGDLIDSPGIREFQLDDLTEKQIVNGFREFKSLIGKCRFRNCQHINEPNCAIKKAIESGNINSSRYESYLNILP